MSYSLLIDVPHEGIWEAVTGSIDDIKEWMKENPSYWRYDGDYSLDIVSNDAPDIYSIIAEIKEQE